MVAIACMAARVVDEVAVSVWRPLHALEPGPELLAQAAMIFDKVFRRSNPSQFGVVADGHWPALGRKLEEIPGTE